MLSIRFGQIVECAESIATYVNGLGFATGDEISLMNVQSIVEAYQLTLRAKEKLLRKQQNTRTRGMRGRGKQSSGRGQSS